jgi:hypothetical protein
VDRLTLDLATNAFDPDVDTLSYRYFVSGGRIIGKGSKVTWDVTGVAPGSYEAKVLVIDKHHDSASKSINLRVLFLGMCPLPCATVTISGPGEVDKEHPITFSANLSGGEPSVNPTYKWTVSDGSIISGQGSPIIEVDTTGFVGQQVTATLEVRGFPPECPSIASCQVQVRKTQ